MEHRGKLPANKRHPRRAADHHDRLDVASFELGIGESKFASLQRACDQRLSHLLETVSSQMFANRVPGQFDHDFSFCKIAETLLGIFSRHPDAVPNVAIELDRIAQSAEQPIDNRAVDIVAADMRITIRREHLEDSFRDSQY